MTCLDRWTFLTVGEKKEGGEAVRIPAEGAVAQHSASLLPFSSLSSAASWALWLAETRGHVICFHFWKLVFAGRELWVRIKFQTAPELVESRGLQPIWLSVDALGGCGIFVFDCSIKRTTDCFLLVGKQLFVVLLLIYLQHRLCYQTPSHLMERCCTLTSTLRHRFLTVPFIPLLMNRMVVVVMMLRSLQLYFFRHEVAHKS